MLYLKENPDKPKKKPFLSKGPTILRKRKEDPFSEFGPHWLAALLARGPSLNLECLVLLFLRTGSTKYIPGLFVYFSMLPHDSQIRVAKTYAPTSILKEVLFRVRHQTELTKAQRCMKIFPNIVCTDKVAGIWESRAGIQETWDLALALSLTLLCGQVPLPLWTCFLVCQTVGSVTHTVNINEGLSTYGYCAEGWGYWGIRHGPCFRTALSPGLGATKLQRGAASLPGWRGRWGQRYDIWAGFERASRVC